MKYVEHERYLGCQLASSVADSVSTTVDTRIGLAPRSIYEIRAVIEDARASVLGGIPMAIQLWQQSVLSSLLYSSEVWTSIPKATMKNLNNLNNQALKSFLGVGKNGCPIPALCQLTEVSECEHKWVSSFCVIRTCLLFSYIHTKSTLLPSNLLEYRAQP